MSTQNNTNNNRTQRRRKRRFTIPTTTRQFQTCLQRLSLKGLSCLFFIADHAMYLLGPLLIALASVIIVGLTYLYFCVMLPMMAGTNWIVTVDDYHSYKNGGAVTTPTGIFHTAIVAFYLINVTYNYYKCVTTSNSGKAYDSVVRELAAVTNFDYPENDEELLQELLAARANNNDASSTQQPQPIPRIHNWQLLTPTEWSYCRFSKQPKPPRSHYDHVTKSLVLNMDHYCPWMFNCVGYFNYRYFVNFLFFTTTGLFYGAMICCRPFLYLGGSEYREQVRASTSGGGGGGVGAMMATVRHLESNSYIPTPNERTSVALGFMICLCLGCAVGCLLVFHLYLTVSAQTTIEFHGNWAKRRKKKGGRIRIRLGVGRGIGK
ncbi:DHHC family palmitoyltransferase [Skeletonema marinoi]|uniref:Palmitoyltransferase n=1 Tax=Skeletonema marinoi TaxID=267567 RepID=A0AAD8YFV6_9STRA|nr:DHHC family palmitoyltransferase [Skeletonema marinoi]